LGTKGTGAPGFREFWSLSDSILADEKLRNGTLLIEVKRRDLMESRKVFIQNPGPGKRAAERRQTYIMRGSEGVREAAEGITEGF
jgi:hypothetical protein